MFWGQRKKLEKTNIGNILLRMGLITEEQLTEALRIKTGRSDLLGEILIATGAVTRSQLERALFKQKQFRGQAIDFVKESQVNLQLLESKTNEMASPLQELKATVNDFFVGIPKKK